MISSGRMMSRRLRIALVCAALLPFGPTPSPASSALTCRDVPELFSAFLRKHVSNRHLSEEIRERVGEIYVRQIDPQRSLLLEADAERVRSQVARAFPALRGKNCEVMAELHGEMLGRHRKAEAAVREIVGDGYELDESASLVLDAEDRGHPQTVEEQRVLLRNLVHFQVSNYLASDHDLADARRRVAERYARARRRWAEQDRETQYSVFLDAFARALDPHSGYLSADALEDFQIGMQLSLEGIGVALSERDGYAVVEQIIPGGAADRLDVLRPKDKIIAVASDDDSEPVDVIDMALREVVRLIRGKKGSRVRLTVLRQEDKAERFEVAIVRDKISLEEQAAKLRFSEQEVEGRKMKLAVLDLPSFYGDRDPSKRQCSKDVAEILRQVKEEKADGLLVDLSRNGGGLLDDAVRISGFFIREGGVVAIRDSAARTRVLPDPDDGTLYSGPMVVLTSRVSASASEILAGALKDYRRAVIVGGDHTFGKGTVQSVIPLRPGLGAMRVTTALFFRPGGASTQNVGVDADVVLPSLFDVEDFGEKTQPYSLPTQTIEAFRGRLSNHPEGSQRWKPITPSLVEQLARRSRERVADDERFDAIRERIAERAEDDGVIQLADILREREANGEESPEETEASPDAPDSDETAANEEDSPQLEEALRILADLVVLES